MIGISACLGGCLCRYDGQQKEIPALKKLVEQGQAKMICPEVLGGLPIPRDPAEIKGGDGFDVWSGKAQVITDKGENVTEQFKKGAQLAFKKLKEQGIDQLILKEKSPSCGSQLIYDGTFSGVKKEGFGVAAAYFQLQGFSILSDEKWLAQVELTSKKE